MLVAEATMTNSLKLLQIPVILEICRSSLHSSALLTLCFHASAAERCLLLVSPILPIVANRPLIANGALRCLHRHTKGACGWYDSVFSGKISPKNMPAVVQRVCTRAGTWPWLHSNITWWHTSRETERPHTLLHWNWMLVGIVETWSISHCILKTGHFRYKWTIAIWFDQSLSVERIDFLVHNALYELICCHILPTFFSLWVTIEQRFGLCAISTVTLCTIRRINGLMFAPVIGRISRSFVEPKHNLANGCRLIK